MASVEMSKTEKLLRDNAVLVVVGNQDDFSRIDIAMLNPAKKYILAIIEAKE